MTALEILEKAKSLIDHPSKWTVGAYARAGNDMPVSVNSELACKFDMGGAIFKALNARFAPTGEQKPEFGRAWKALAGAIGTSRLLHWQDELGRDHNDVMKAFDDAIESLKGK